MLLKMEKDYAEDVEHSVVYDNDIDDDDDDRNDVFAWGSMEELLSFSCIREMFEWVQNLIIIFTAQQLWLWAAWNIPLPDFVT